MQRYFLDPEADAFLKSARPIIPNVQKIIMKFRKQGLPVIFTRHAHRKGEETGQMGRWWKDELPWDGDKQSELIPEIKPEAGEPIITKRRYSAFERTEIEARLKGCNVNTVVLCGVMTHLCVETSARHAFILDFQPVVVSDACATQTEEHHKASLLNLSHGFAHVVDTRKIISMLENSKHETKACVNRES